MRTATFCATRDLYACFFGGSILPLRWVSGWVAGMGRFGVISPHGRCPFRLGTWPIPFPIGDMDWPLSFTYLQQSDVFQGYRVHLCVFLNRHTKLGTW